MFLRKADGRRWEQVGNLAFGLLGTRVGNQKVREDLNGVLYVFVWDLLVGMRW